MLTENEISGIVIDISINIHRIFGPGLLESVYETILCYELRKMGLGVENQKIIPVIWDDLKMDLGFRADIIVENKVIIENKSVEYIHPSHP
jgi:GxxExxY protein